MKRPKHQVTSGEDLFVGIDLHKHRWHVTIRTFDVELFSASIPGTWEALQRVLARYAGHQLQAVYEAGYFGFRLHDRLVAHGIPYLPLSLTGYHAGHGSLYEEPLAALCQESLVRVAIGQKPVATIKHVVGLRQSRCMASQFDVVFGSRRLNQVNCLL